MKHLIIEGMDGSGKDTLIQELMAYRGWPGEYKVHDRASTSLGGPVDSLAQWVEDDMAFIGNGKNNWIYNRHPLISETIYGDYRGHRKPIAPAFADAAWWTHCARIVGMHSIVIWVHPPYAIVDKVLREQGLNAHMPGVYENRLQIYTRYALFQWPGESIRYDRTRDSVPALINTINLKLEK
ncbi:MAG: hypothetical protein ABW022_11275 [Actinoplanes sp.]